MLIPWPEFLTQTDGETRFANTRIAVPEFIHAYNTLGYSAEMIALEYPSLDLPVIHKFIAFYLEHADEVDAYVDSEIAAIDQLRAASPNRISHADLRKRMTPKSRTA